MAAIKSYGLVGLGNKVQYGKRGGHVAFDGSDFVLYAPDGITQTSLLIANATTEGAAVNLGQMQAAISAATAGGTIVDDVIQLYEKTGISQADGSFTLDLELDGADTFVDAFGLVMERIRSEASDASDARDALSGDIANVAGDVLEVSNELALSQTNIGLTPEGLFVPNEDDDLLKDSTSIVEALHLLSGEIGSSSADVVAIRLLAEANEGNIALLQDFQLEAEGAIDDLELAVQGVVANVSSLSESMDLRIAEIGDLESNVSVLQSDLDIAEGILATAIQRDGSVAFTGDQAMGGNRITGLGAPTGDNDAATKIYVDQALTQLGNAFNYVGMIEAGSEEEPFDMDTLPEGGKDAGDYYKVSVAGYVKLGTTVHYCNVHDGVVVNMAGGIDKIDNTDSVVTGEEDEIVVSGTPDTGYHVALAPAYKAGVVDAIGDVASDLANAVSDIADLEANAVAQDGLISALDLRVEANEGAIVDLEANAVAQDGLISALDLRVETNEGAIGDLEANAIAQDGLISALDLRVEANEGAIGDLEANAVAQDGLISALDLRVDAVEGAVGAVEGDVIALEANAVTQQGEIDDLRLAIQDLSTDTIIAQDGSYSAQATSGGVLFSASEDAVAGAASLNISLANSEVVLEAQPTDGADDADLRLVPAGNGKVFIGAAGAGVVQSEEGFDLNLIAQGEGQINLISDIVSVQNSAGAIVAEFSADEIAPTKLGVHSDASGINLAVEAVDIGVDDADLSLTPLGAGAVVVNGAAIKEVADAVDATDAVNLGQVEAMLEEAASGASSVLMGVVGAINENVTLGTISGTISRIKVIIESAYGETAAIRVGNSTVAADLVASEDIDEMLVGVYVIDTARVYANEPVIIRLTGSAAGTGAAKVILEYVKA